MAAAHQSQSAQKGMFVILTLFIFRITAAFNISALHLNASINVTFRACYAGRAAGGRETRFAVHIDSRGPTQRGSTTITTRYIRFMMRGLYKDCSVCYFN